MQLVSWPSQATKASSFHWNRWHAQGRKHAAIFIPRASKLTLRYHSSPIHSEITESWNCTGLTIGLLFVGLVVGGCFGSVFWGRVLYSKNEYKTQSLASITQITVGVKYRNKGDWNNPLPSGSCQTWAQRKNLTEHRGRTSLSTEEEPHSSKAFW